MIEFKANELPADYSDELHGKKPLVKIEETDQSVVISYTFPSFFTDDCVQLPHKDFQLVYIEGVGFHTEKGKPLLPSFGRFLSIPPNYVYNSVGKIVTSDEDREVGKFPVLVAPAQENVTDHEYGAFFDYAEEWYQQHSDPYPDKIVEVTGPFKSIGGYRALLIHVRPLQYLPSQRKLVGYHKIEVEIKFDKEEDDDNGSNSIGWAFDRTAFGNLFLNPGTTPNVPAIQGKKEIEVEFLIIYGDGLGDAARNLARWKTRRGIQTEFVSTTAIPQSQAGQNEIAKIKDYIRTKKHRSPQLRYLLLLGDVDKIPSEEVPGASGKNNITDLYYSMDADFEAKANPYVFPCLSIGRIPISNSKEAEHVVNMIKKYEEKPPDDKEYYKMVLASFVQLNREYLETVEDICCWLEDKQNLVVERIYSPGTDHPRLFEPRINSGVVWYPKEASKKILETVKAGRSLIGYRGHGAPDGWDGPSLVVGQLLPLTTPPPWNPTVFLSINCSTGAFDLSPSKCFAEVVLTKGVGASVVAATRNSNTWLNNYLIKALYDGLFGGLLPTFSNRDSVPFKYSRLGDLLNYGQAFLLTKKSTDYQLIKEHLELYHLIGDPTIEVWKKPPEQAANLTAFRKEEFLELSLPHNVPEGTVITIWQGENQKARLAPTSGGPIKISLEEINLPEDKKLQIQICFWAPGYRYNEIPVTL
jgi:hypothetical protein